MAMSQSAPCPGGFRKNLKCQICREIFRHPKLMSCSHTFCLECLENLATANGHQTFLCPTCHKTIDVPPEGVQGFMDNQYISEQELQRERLWSSNVICSTHPEEVLKYFCTEADCDRPICLSCKLTDHFFHSIEDLSKSADRSKKKLRQELDRLEYCIQNVSAKFQLAQDNVKAARDKAKLLEELVHLQHRWMVAKVTTLRDKVLKGLADVSSNVDQELSEDARNTEQALDSMLDLQKRVKNAISGKVNDVEVVAVDKEMRKGRGSVSELGDLTDSKSPDTARPGLFSFIGNLRESLKKDALLYFGSPVKLQVPSREGVDVIRCFYRCGKGDMFREIHSIYRTVDGSLHVAYGGKPPTFAKEKVVHLDISGEKLNEFHPKRRVIFDKSYRTFTYSPMPGDFCKDIQANSSREFRIKLCFSHPWPKTTIQKKKSGAPGSKPVDFEIHAADKPQGFDANANGSLFVVINEEEASEPVEDAFRREDSKRVTEKGERKKSVVRTVRLYRRNLSDPVATYRSPHPHFFPTAVTFWNTGRQELILIADSMHDCVHMVLVRRADFQFLRFLHASGCGDIVRPTALEVDWESNIWVGCETGWLLKCQPFVADIPDPDQSEREEDMFLDVEIPSPRSSFEGVLDA